MSALKLCSYHLIETSTYPTEQGNTCSICIWSPDEALVFVMI